MPNIPSLEMQNPSAIPAFLALSPQKSPTQFHEDPLFKRPRGVGENWVPFVALAKGTRVAEDSRE